MNAAIQETMPALMDGGTVRWHGLFTPARLDALERHCDALALEQARLNSGASSIRTTRVAWVQRNAQTEALYRDMEAIVLRLNAELFRFELTGLTTLQFAVYEDNQSGFFDWHNDYGRSRDDPGQEPRKITLSLQLTDGAAYDGCDLEIRAAHPVDVAPRERGSLVAFRANALHRVMPVTRGRRRRWWCGRQARNFVDLLPPAGPDVLKAPNGGSA